MPSTGSGVTVTGRIITAIAAWPAGTSSATAVADISSRIATGDAGTIGGATAGTDVDRVRIAAASLLLALTCPAHALDPIEGRATVIDGDTVAIRGQRFRLQGVDTPESAQLCRNAAGKDYRCGQTAALALADKIGTATIACAPVTTDRYGRTVAVCSLGELDLNGWLVEQGYGLAYRKYSTAYVRQEDAARAAGRGLWAGTFTAPWDWRHGVRAGEAGPVESAPAPGSAPSATVAAGECRIKGNINRNGERIYHLPGARDYERTVIDAVSGERMFCSEDEARAAGWRASRR